MSHSLHFNSGTFISTWISSSVLCSSTLTALSFVSTLKNASSTSLEWRGKLWISIMATTTTTSVLKGSWAYGQGFFYLCFHTLKARSMTILHKECLKLNLSQSFRNLRNDLFVHRKTSGNDTIHPTLYMGIYILVDEQNRSRPNNTYLVLAAKNVFLDCV